MNYQINPHILVDYEIEKLLDMQIIRIVPILDITEQLNPTGLDLTLDTRFKKIIKSNVTSIDPIKPFKPHDYYEDIELDLSYNEYFILHPGEFVLAQSYEYISLPNYISGGLDGKSSLGRLSLSVHTTAGSVDPGFKGHLTLELYNNGGLPIKLYPLMPVARLVFYLTNKCRKTYQGIYSGQTEVRPSKYYESKFAKILRRNDNEVIP